MITYNQQKRSFVQYNITNSVQLLLFIRSNGLFLKILLIYYQQLLPFNKQLLPLNEQKCYFLFSKCFLQNRFFVFSHLLFLCLFNNRTRGSPLNNYLRLQRPCHIRHYHKAIVTCSLYIQA